jgi:hypothetical protein
MTRFLVRFDADLMQRLTRMTAMVRAQRPGGIVSQSSVVRELLHAALDDPRIVRRLQLNGCSAPSGTRAGKTLTPRN